MCQEVGTARIYNPKNLEPKNAVTDILIYHQIASPMLSGLELNITSSLLNILRLHKAATEQISGDKYCTL